MAVSFCGGFLLGVLCAVPCRHLTGKTEGERVRKENADRNKTLFHNSGSGQGHPEQTHENRRQGLVFGVTVLHGVIIVKF